MVDQENGFTEEKIMATALITGANRGIGLALSQQLSARGDTVIAVVRKPSQELSALNGIRIESAVDVTNAEHIQQLAQRLEGEAIDLLINNAGVLTRETLEDLNIDQIRFQFEVNALGPLRITHALLPNLINGSKVAIITSRMGSIEDNTSGSRYGYRMSKAAVNMAGMSLARDLAPRGIPVALLHPGYVRTKLTNQNGLINPDESAEGLIARIDGLNLDNSGTFWHANGTVLPW